ncbi:MAG: hypothetical protein ACRDQB_16950 [Thermocrispum sp.]
MRWLLPVLIGVVSLAVAGGVLAREFYQRERAQTRPTVELPAATSLKPAEQPGSPEVSLTPDAARHPHGETVRALLEAYTNGINERNYERWKTAVSAERIADKPEQKWLEGYRSTRNGSILVHRIETGPDDALRMLFSFTSTQDLADAPPTLQSTCIRWRLMLPIVRQNGQWKIATVVPGTIPESRRC